MSQTYASFRFVTQAKCLGRDVAITDPIQPNSKEFRQQPYHFREFCWLVLRVKFCTQRYQSSADVDRWPSKRTNIVTLTPGVTEGACFSFESATWVPLAPLAPLAQLFCWAARVPIIIAAGTSETNVSDTHGLNANHYCSWPCSEFFSRLGGKNNGRSLGSEYFQPRKCPEITCLKWSLASAVANRNTNGLALSNIPARHSL